MKIVISVLLQSLLTFSFIVYPVPIQAQTPQLLATVDTSDALKPLVILTNTDTQACQAVASSLGTISISSVVQNGQNIEPIPIKIGIDDDLEYLLVSKLTILQPGETLEIPLDVFPYENGHALQSVTWSPEAGAFGMIFPFRGDRPYDLNVTYSAPLSVSGDVPLCGTASTSTSQSSPLSNLDTSKTAYILDGIGLLVVLLVIAVFLFLRSKKNRSKTVKTAIIGFLFLSATTAFAQPAQAQYSVSDGSSGTFESCMAQFAEHPDITGPVLDALADEQIDIITNSDRENYATDWPDGSFRIHWDDTSEYTYAGGDGTVTSTPCDRLFHEMYHVYDMLNGTFSRDDCAGSGIETKEVNATRAQNVLREAMGLPPRTHYGTTALPEGDCSEPAEDSTPVCTGDSCGSSTGDPHLRTFDNLNYSFMAVGEFTLVKSTDGAFEVQTRQEPWFDSRRVSINTAVAMKMGDTRIQLQAAERTFTMLINGEEQPFESRAIDEGTITVDGQNKVLVVWPDGTRVHTTRIARGVHVVVDPSLNLAGKLEGLLGNYNSDSADDLRVRGTTDPIQPEFNELYPRFADSWRITDDSSLFTYLNGTNTNSYTDRSFPDKQATAQDVPNRAMAEAICREYDITDEVVLQNCILDVGTTGLPEFALAARLSQQVINVKTVDYGGKKYPVSIENPGDEATIKFEGTAGGKVFIDLTQTDLPNQCGAFRLLYNGRLIKSGCIVDGRGMIDGADIDETGTYTVALRSTRESTGSGVIQIVQIADQNETITPERDSVIARISKPGEESRLTFEGTAGQIVFVKISDSTLPNQCGGVGIRSPERTIGTGCIVNGQGLINRTELPSDGIYTIFVNPTDANTGTATVQLTLVEDNIQEITLGGPPVTATFTKPGSIAEFTFPAIAGQRVFAEILSSTLPGQCGGVRIIGPNDKTIDTTCISGGTGTFNDKGIVLPESGMYSIRVDPADGNTGEITVRVRE